MDKDTLIGIVIYFACDDANKINKRKKRFWVNEEHSFSSWRYTR